LFITQVVVVVPHMVVERQVAVALEVVELLEIHLVQSLVHPILVGAVAAVILGLQVPRVVQA
jgi:hypothetical protein